MAGTPTGPGPRDAGTPEAQLSIGVLSRATGIPVETLRTWESRYGFPAPERKPSGHRLYPSSLVPRLLRIAEALTLGHRASEAVPASDPELSVLLRTRSRDAIGSGAPELEMEDDLAEILRAVVTFDAARLRSHLEADWARLGVRAFVRERLGPLVARVGEGWRTGALEIRHEHFLTEQVGDLLRALRLPFDTRAGGPPVVFATLAGETHGLGLQMAALIAASSGCRVLYMGTDVPLAQICAAARDTAAAAVALSVSSASDASATGSQLAELRASLPIEVDVVIGGAGAPSGVPGIRVLDGVDALAAWCEALDR